MKSDQRADLTGQQFGFLTVVKMVPVDFSVHQSHRRYFVIARCDCGTEGQYRSSSLTRGMTSSCGCMRGMVNRHLDDGVVRECLRVGCKKPRLSPMMRFCSEDHKVEHNQRHKEQVARRQAILKAQAPKIAVLLPRDCSPEKTPTAVRVSDVERNLSCRQYDRCLDFAIAANWPGFRCAAACPGYEAAPIQIRAMSTALEMPLVRWD